MGKETISRTTFAKGVTAGVIAAASLGILTVGEYAIDTNTSDESASSAVTTESTAPAAEASDITAADLSACAPGTYTASAKGISSDVTVTVTIDETGITGITADLSGETPDIGGLIGDEMIEKVLSAQSASVDGVAGATITSDAFKAAVEDCIAQASGGSSDTEAATETMSDNIEAEDASEAEAASDNIDTEGTESVPGLSAADASAAGLTPGTYTGSAKGISSDVTVTATFDGSGITALSTDVSGETPDIGGAIGAEMIDKALSAQSADIDGVAGATITSDAFKAALLDCIAQASGGASGEEVQTADTEPGTDTDAEENGSAEAASEVPETDDTETASELPKTDDAEAASELPEAGTAGQGFTPGAYTASAPGLSSDVRVVAVFDESNITSLSADVSGETPDIGGLIGDEMIEKALNAQSADIDGVAGATITSDAFKAALSDCIAMASGTASAEEAETDADAVEAAANVAAAETELDESDSESDDEIDGADGPASAFADGKVSDLTESPEGPFVPGAYTAAAAGINSDVTVTITFDEVSIVDIEVDVSGETAGIGAMIDDDIAAQILTAQSADVDGVSGATITSDAVKTAADDCISQAKAGNNADAETESEAETEAN